MDIIYLTKQGDMSRDSQDRPALEITPQMIEAGASVLEEHSPSHEEEALARMVYIAMLGARPESR